MLTPFAAAPAAQWTTLAQYLRLRADAARVTGRRAADLLGQRHCATPFVVGIAGSVAVGKSTAALTLAGLLNAEGGAKAQIVSTDSFLFPNAELERRGASARKGFPESFDRRALLRFLSDVKAGLPALSTPVYSHRSYDIVPTDRVMIESPDVLIVEGVNVLGDGPLRADGRPGRAARDFVDFGIYLDADASDIRGWFVERLLAMRLAALDDPGSFFSRFAAVSEQQATMLAEQVWAAINEPNLREHIAPTRANADAIVTKAADHSIQRVIVRRV